MKIFIIKNLKYISLFCTIAVMVAIFLFSAQSAQQSSKLSGRIVTVVLRIVMPNYDKLPFLERQKIKDKVSYIVRKTAHFTEFAALGFFLILYLLSLYEHFNL
ncbi:VanZ family protein, partial [Candidatus Ruminimicrobium bovinum]|uniref:VanZ family protein n=1 Tax=Candidatus Ruminimicrobium bovinum TaxID=3242779 RepID=UPI0039B85BEE